MNDKFTFTLDRARGLVRIRMQGFYGIEDVEAFFAARRRAHAELGLPPNRHLTLNDVRDMKIQSQEAVAAFRLMLSDPAWRSRRLAFVAGQTLARSQLMRALAGRDDAGCFENVTEAEAWLLDEMPAVRLRSAAG